MATSSFLRRRGAPGASTGLPAGFLPAGFLLIIALLVPLSGAPLAKERFYAGGGPANRSFISNFRENAQITHPNLNLTVFPGQLEFGGGIAFQGGFVVHENFAVEVMLISTSHDANHSGFALQQDVDISTIGFGFRLMANFGDGHDVFFRGGLGGINIHYEDNTDIGGTFMADSDIFGNGFFLGAGYKVRFGPIGVELGGNHERYDLDRVETADLSFEIRNIPIVTTSAHLIITFNFGTQGALN